MYLSDMITYRIMTPDMAGKLTQIDRSESIDKIYEWNGSVLSFTETRFECSTWDPVALKEMQERFSLELQNGGMAVGAFKGEILIGFGVLGHTFLGPDHDQLQVDLMYVSRRFRKQGIGTKMLEMLGAEAKKRGAKSLYISSTETRSAVSFYMGNGAAVTDLVDEELFRKEPKEIHMIKKLE